MRRSLPLLSSALLILGSSAARADTVEMQAASLVASALAAAKARLTGLSDDLMQAPAEAARLFNDIGHGLASGTGVLAVTYCLILLLVAAGSEWLYWTYAAASLRAIEAAPVVNPRHAFRLAMKRLALMSFGLLIFVAAVLATAASIQWPQGMPALVITSAVLVTTVRVAWLLAAIVAAPGVPSQRLAAIKPSLASAIVAGVVIMALLFAVARFVPDLVANSGNAPHLASALRVIVATLITVIVLVAVLVAIRPRRRVDAARRRLPPGFPMAFLAISMVLCTYGLWLVGGGVAATLLAILIVVIAVELRLRPIVFFFWSDQIVPRSEGPAPGETGDDGVESGLVPSIVLSLARYGVITLGIVAALFAIGMPLGDMMATDNPVMRLVLRLLGVAGLALATNMAWIAIRVSIDRRLRLLAPLDPHGDPGPNARLLTLLPLLRTTSAIVFLVLLVLSALWTLGIEITPLLAGAGVFGLALGFGAQALVRDVIAGVFYLVEDVFRIGEYIESGPTTKGTVERITLRTVALRHHNGPLHFVPYGSLGTVRNNSRDWVIEKFNLPLPVNVDSEHIRKIIKKVGEGMLADPEIGPLMREPLKAKLYRIDPGIKIFRCKFQTAPGKQFDVRAQAFKRIEAALKDAGIHFADGTQTVLVPAAAA